MGHICDLRIGELFERHGRRFFFLVDCNLKPMRLLMAAEAKGCMNRSNAIQQNDVS